MAAVELAIFDCDGVLVDSEPISNGVLAEMLAAEGLQMTLAEARAAFQGMLLSEVRTSVEQRLGRALEEDWIEHYERVREDAFMEGLEPVAGAREAVRDVLELGIRVCVASQGKLAKSRFTLGHTGLLEFFDEQAIFSAEMVPLGKPHPDLFLHAAASMGVEPQRCVVIEDSPSGVRAAVGAGMRVLGLCADSDAEALRAAGAELVDGLEQVPKLLAGAA
ncbi:MAG TPA: HAD family phosphatase [Solirubrobacteraceae bacterium]|nr:HAD family phosphatase [Solirubrobacteraceae bacterium]